MYRRFLSLLILAALLAAAFTGTVYADVSRFLSAADSYGHLYPYVQVTETAVEYGFCDAAGSKVTDPNYSAVMRLPLGSSFFYVMETYDNDDYACRQYASSDGRLVSELCFMDINSIGGKYILCLRDEVTFELLDESFSICATELDFRYMDLQLIPRDYAEGRFICSCPGGEVLTDSSGEPIGQSAERIEFDRFGDALLYDCLDRISVMMPDDRYYSTEGSTAFLAWTRLNEEQVLVILPDGSCRITDLQGNAMWTDIQRAYIGWNGGYQLAGDESSPDCIYRNLSRSGELLMEGTGSDYSGWQELGFGSYFSRTWNGCTVIRDFISGEEIVLPFEGYHEILWAGSEDREAVCSFYLNGDKITLFMPDGSLHTADCSTLNFMSDPYTGESYFITPGSDGGLTLRDKDFTTELFSFEGWYDISDGVLTAAAENCCVLYRMDGTVLFFHEYGPKG